MQGKGEGGPGKVPRNLKHELDGTFANSRGRKIEKKKYTVLGFWDGFSKGNPVIRIWGVGEGILRFAS